MTVYHRGVACEWRGWRETPAQSLCVGWWEASLTPKRTLIASTGGTVYRQRWDSPFNMRDLTFIREERDRVEEHRRPSDAVRSRALDRLRAYLDEMGVTSAPSRYYLSRQ